MQAQPHSSRTFLFLQGPLSPFFPRVADRLEALGHRVRQIRFCFGDGLFWNRNGAKNFRKRAEEWPAYIAAFLEREAITDVVLLGEQRYYHKQAISAAKVLGINVTVTDFGYFRPDWITVETGGMSGNSLFPRHPEDIIALANQYPAADLKIQFDDNFWAMARWDIAYHLSNTLLWFFYPHYKTFQLHHPIPGYLGTGIRMMLRNVRQKQAAGILEKLVHSKTGFYLFPLQLESDYSIRAYSDFPDLKSAICRVLESFASFAPMDRHLVVKIHPLDPGLMNWERTVRRVAKEFDMVDRVHFIDGGILKAIVEASEGVVLINSTVGLTTLRLGRPLIALGQAIYDVPGLAFEGDLDEFWLAGKAPDPVIRDAFVRALIGAAQIRGVFYKEPGLSVAVEAAAEKLIGMSKGASPMQNNS